MKRWILILVLVAAALLLFAPLATAQLVSFPLDARSLTLDLPLDVTAPDGTTIPAGRYAITYPEAWTSAVGRPPASMGFWRGPQMEMVPVASGHLDSAIERAMPRPVFRLKTAIEVRVLWDIPARQGDVFTVQRRPNTAVPLIRQGRLHALVVGEQMLYVTEAVAQR